MIQDMMVWTALLLFAIVVPTCGGLLLEAALGRERPLRRWLSGD